MTLLTGTPLGTITNQDDLYIEGAPYVYFQDYSAPVIADGNGYYCNISGSVAYPVYLLGCVQDVSFGEDVTMNMVRCDTIGDKDAIQKRNHLEVTLSITTILPLTILYHILNASVPLVVGDVEKMGIGAINNARNYHVYMPKVYDEDTGDYLAITLHKAKFVDAWTIAMKQGEPWQLTGLKLFAFADSTKPDAQSFATIIRADVSAI
jgi:hypothetical protein